MHTWNIEMHACTYICARWKPQARNRKFTQAKVHHGSEAQLERRETKKKKEGKITESGKERGEKSRLDPGPWHLSQHHSQTSGPIRDNSPGSALYDTLLFFFFLPLFPPLTFHFRNSNAALCPCIWMFLCICVWRQFIAQANLHLLPRRSILRLLLRRFLF